MACVPRRTHELHGEVFSIFLAATSSYVARATDSYVKRLRVLPRGASHQKDSSKETELEQPASSLGLLITGNRIDIIAANVLSSKNHTRFSFAPPTRAAYEHGALSNTSKHTLAETHATIQLYSATNASSTWSNGTINRSALGHRSSGGYFQARRNESLTESVTSSQSTEAMFFGFGNSFRDQ